MTRFPSSWLSWFAVFVLLGASLLPVSPAYAQAEPPPAPPPAAPDPAAGPPGAQHDGDGNWRMQQDAAPVESADAATSGGPDDYGYVWNDNVPLNWIDATNGTDTGLSGNSTNQRTGAIPLPFAFKHYEAVYSSVYIGAAGYLTLLDSANWNWSNQIHTPRPSVPNAVISPFSTPLTLATSGKNGRVFYQSGGAAPNRYFVIAWNEVTRQGEDERYTFEVVLYETGDILFQYKTMEWGDDSWYYCGYTGIEDAEGLDGFDYSLDYCVAPSIRDGVTKAIRFTRPAASARVKLTPRGQGRFSHAGATETYEVTVYNNGELGADAYNVTLTSPWLATAEIDGRALTDTNGDGTPDTGSIGQGERKKLKVQVKTPAFAGAADTNLATLMLQSVLNPTVQRSAQLRTTIPTPFAQIYEDRASPGIRLTQPNPESMITRKIATTSDWGGNMALAGTISGGYVAMWSEWINDIGYLRYILLDRYGAPKMPIQNLVTMPMGWFNYFAAAVAPNGNIGLSWAQTQSRWVNDHWEDNFNVYFAILDPAGGFLLAPTNLTNNGGWLVDWDTDNVPKFFNVQLAATPDNRFSIAWEREITIDSDWQDNIFYAVYSGNGQAVRAVTQFSNDATTNLNTAEMPRLAALDGNRVVLAYYSWNADGVRVAMLNSAGDRIMGPVNIDDDYGWPSAVSQMSGGSLLLVWNVWNLSRTGLRYALLNGVNLGIAAGPTDLVNPFSFTGDRDASIAVDAANRAVVTWSENDWSYRPVHFYALIDSAGAILVPPTPWLAARTPASGATVGVNSSYNGYGIAPNFAYSPTSTTQSDAQIDAPSMSTGAPNGSAQVVVNIANRGLPAASGVVVTAELDPNLTFLNAEPAPAVNTQTATADGDVYTWNVPDLRYLSQGLIVMNTGVPSATIGSHYPVTITIVTASSDANQDNNSAVTEVMVAEEVYLPAIDRNDD
jgi:hypothetical protein